MTISSRHQQITRPSLILTGSLRVWFLLIKGHCSWMLSTIVKGHLLLVWGSWSCSPAPLMNSLSRIRGRPDALVVYVAMMTSKTASRLGCRWRVIALVVCQNEIFLIWIFRAQRRPLKLVFNVERISHHIVIIRVLSSSYARFQTWPSSTATDSFLPHTCLALHIYRRSLNISIPLRLWLIQK